MDRENIGRYWERGLNISRWAALAGPLLSISGRYIEVHYPEVGMPMKFMGDYIHNISSGIIALDLFYLTYKLFPEHLKQNFMNMVFREPLGKATIDVQKIPHIPAESKLLKRTIKDLGFFALSIILRVTKDRLVYKH